MNKILFWSLIKTWKKLWIRSVENISTTWWRSRAISNFKFFSVFQRFISSTNKRPTTSSPALIIYCSRVLNHNWWLINTWWLTSSSLWVIKKEENLWKSGFSSFLVVFKIAFAFGPIIHFVELVWIIIMSHRRQDPPTHHLRWPIIASQSPLANQPTHHAYHPIIISQSLSYSLLTPTRWRQRAAYDDSSNNESSQWRVAAANQKKKPAKYPNILICKYLCKLDL